MSTDRWRRRESHWDGILGMNARNALIAANNPSQSVALVNRKYETKLALQRADIPVAPTIGVASNGPMLRQLVEALPDAWAMSPTVGAGVVGS